MLKSVCGVFLGIFQDLLCFGIIKLIKSTPTRTSYLPNELLVT